MTGAIKTGMVYVIIYDDTIYILYICSVNSVVNNKDREFSMYLLWRITFLYLLYKIYAITFASWFSRNVIFKIFPEFPILPPILPVNCIYLLRLFFFNKLRRNTQMFIHPKYRPSKEGHIFLNIFWIIVFEKYILKNILKNILKKYSKKYSKKIF